MFIVASVLALVAAALHVFIWWLESMAWEGPRATRVFGHPSPAAAKATKELAFNQGFYNLFLAVIAVAGVIAIAAGAHAVGAALVLAGCGSMLAASLVLALGSAGDRTRLRAAVTQGTVPLLAVVATVLAFVI